MYMSSTVFVDLKVNLKSLCNAQNMSKIHLLKESSIQHSDMLLRGLSTKM